MSSVKTTQVLKMLLPSGREVQIHSGSPTHTEGSHGETPDGPHFTVVRPGHHSHASLPLQRASIAAVN